MGACWRWPSLEFTTESALCDAPQVPIIDPEVHIAEMLGPEAGGVCKYMAGGVLAANGRCTSHLAMRRRCFASIPSTNRRDAWAKAGW